MSPFVRRGDIIMSKLQEEKTIFISAFHAGNFTKIGEKMPKQECLKTIMSFY